MKTTVTTAIALTALLSAGFASGAEMVQFAPGMPARAADFNGNFATLNGRADEAENRIADLEDAVGKMTELTHSALAFMPSDDYTGMLFHSYQPLSVTADGRITSSASVATVAVSVTGGTSYTRTARYGGQCDFSSSPLLAVGTQLRSVIQGACSTASATWPETDVFTLSGGQMVRNANGVAQVVLPAELSAGTSFDASMTVMGVKSQVIGQVEYLGPYHNGLVDMGTCALVSYKAAGAAVYIEGNSVGFSHPDVLHVFCERKGFVGWGTGNQSGFGSLIIEE